MSRTFRRRKGNRFNCILLEHDYVGREVTHKNRLRYLWQPLGPEEINQLIIDYAKDLPRERALFYADGGRTHVKTAGLKQETNEKDRRHTRDCLSRVTIENAEEFDIPPADTRHLMWSYS